MLGLVGTIPENGFPLVSGEAVINENRLIVGEKQVAVNRGTPAMIAAAARTLACLNQPSPFCYLVGDIGRGDGCRDLYKYLAEHLPESSFKALALHYFQPDVKLFKKVVAAIEKMSPRPTLIADAGFMYVAKMGGDAPFFDLFTPDAGELAYLADENAPHPFYTRGFILHMENRAPDLIERAYRHNNAASYLLVKGAKDYLADKNGLIGVVDRPKEETMEAIGGTGDTLTGIVSALIASGLDIKSASLKAARVNRLAGLYARPSPATQVHEIIAQIPRALEEAWKTGEADL